MGERQRENEVTINTALIPDDVANTIAASTLKSMKAFLQRPGAKELLNAKIAENGKEYTA